MNRLFLALLCVGVFNLGIANTAVAGGVSICIAKNENNSDIEYFIRYSPDPDVNGYAAWSFAREDYALKYSSTPTCRNSAVRKTGHWVILQSMRRPLNKWALGFGDTPAEALTSAKDEMETRDWGWSDQRDGSTMVEQGRF